MTREQIEKAADDYAAMAIATFVNGDFDRHAIAEAFEEGAKWRVNSVWHDASEAPELKRDFIYQAVRRSGKVHRGMTILLDDDDWELTKKCCLVEHWAYVDDLLPERKEETE